MHGYHTEKVCQAQMVTVIWESYGLLVSKTMANDCKLSAFVDKLHSDEVNYSVKFN